MAWTSGESRTCGFTVPLPDDAPIPSLTASLGPWKDADLYTAGVMRWRGAEASASFPKIGGGLKHILLTRGLVFHNELQVMKQAAVDGEIQFVELPDPVDGKPLYGAHLVTSSHILETPVARVLRPIIETRLLPYLQDRFGVESMAVNSVVLRRFRPGERVELCAHHNARAYMTAVMGLGRNCADEGPYVQTGAAADTQQLIDLEEGMFVTFKYDLCFGFRRVSSESLYAVFEMRDTMTSCTMPQLPLWYGPLAESGDIDAQACLAKLYNEGLDEQRTGASTALATAWARKAAEGGHPWACFQLSELCSRGSSDAIRWCRIAAEQGLCQAQVKLALALWNGEGTTQGEQEAVRWMHAAAAQGHLEAMHKLGIALTTGRGVARNPALSAAWVYKAASAGLPAAQNALGAAFLSGEGVEQSFTIAREWFTSAAKGGDPLAQCNLGVMYAQGLADLPRDYQEACHWYRSSAAQGCADGEYNLGLIYAKGLGVRKDLQTAHKWLAQAAAKGQEQAVAAMPQLECAMKAAGLDVRISGVEKDSMPTEFVAVD